MWIDTTYRSKEEEIMDDLDMSGELLIKTLDKIAQINQWLGGNRLTIQGVKDLLDGKDKSIEYTIIDLGCGNGDMLRALSRFGAKHGYTLILIGIDANASTINYAKDLSVSFQNIEYKQLDIFSKEFDNLDYDIALSTLFLHHFESEKVDDLIAKWTARAKVGVVVNDLHRHPLAYYLFKIIAFLIGNEMVKTDGLISILRGFRKSELESFANKLIYKSEIRWRWAFRYQWIIQK